MGLVKIGNILVSYKRSGTEDRKGLGREGVRRRLVDAARGLVGQYRRRDGGGQGGS